jgi:hypothetical protein
MFMEKRTNRKLDKLKLDSKSKVNNIKKALRRLGPTFFNSILKFCIDIEEEKIACLIVAYYNIKVGEKLIRICL